MKLKWGRLAIFGVLFCPLNTFSADNWWDKIHKFLNLPQAQAQKAEEERKRKEIAAQEAAANEEAIKRQKILAEEEDARKKGEEAAKRQKAIITANAESDAWHKKLDDEKKKKQVEIARAEAIADAKKNKKIIKKGQIIGKTCFSYTEDGGDCLRNKFGPDNVKIKVKCLLFTEDKNYDFVEGVMEISCTLKECFQGAKTCGENGKVCKLDGSNCGIKDSSAYKDATYFEKKGSGK